MNKRLVLVMIGLLLGSSIKDARAQLPDLETKEMSKESALLATAFVSIQNGDKETFKKVVDDFASLGHALSEPLGAVQGQNVGKSAENRLAIVTLGQFFLMLAIEGKQVAIVRYLGDDCSIALDTPIDMENTLIHGFTPLMFAVMSNSLPVVQYLAGKGVSVRASVMNKAQCEELGKMLGDSIRFNSGITALTLASAFGYHDIQEFLTRCELE